MRFGNPRATKYRCNNIEIEKVFSSSVVHKTSVVRQQIKYIEDIADDNDNFVVSLVRHALVYYYVAKCHALHDLLALNVIQTYIDWMTRNAGIRCRFQFLYVMPAVLARIGNATINKDFQFQFRVTVE